MAKKLSPEQLRNRARKQLAIEHLGGRCVYCGNDDVRVLEFDHIVPLARSGKQREKPNQIPGIILSRPAEESEFQLLCANCHRIKTYEDLHSETAKAQLAENIAKRKTLKREMVENTKKDIEADCEAGVKPKLRQDIEQWTNLFGYKKCNYEISNAGIVRTKNFKDIIPVIDGRVKLNLYGDGFERFYRIEYLLTKSFTHI